MAVKAPEVYQGSDWLTYRWSVAQVFDTLDRIRDLCRQAPALAIPGSGEAPARYEIPEGGLIDLFGCLQEFFDDLTGEMDAMLADLHTHLAHVTAHRWIAFEMQLHLRQMRQHVMAEQLAKEPSTAAIDVILSLAARIRDLLKVIDQ